MSDTSPEPPFRYEKESEGRWKGYYNDYLLAIFTRKEDLTWEVFVPEPRILVARNIRKEFEKARKRLENGQEPLG